ncbi:hypothetical protein CALVIDRAFT_210405 [Calocera viscosa TUFC12733]|uniref:GYF domain-containing protein n=1 Tax=Calocera viscosa (strain TUFC12733) TaxID=1330018 RepID=A0A167RB71_CALVF|nr:hypothetical protein CALVIDRAFT_210405 [Calocera viscosa TUFC12733]
MREKFGTSGAFSTGVRGRRRDEGAPADMPPPLRTRNSSFGQAFASTNPPTPGGLGSGRRAMGTFDGVLGGGTSRDDGVWSRRKLPDSGGVNGTATSSAFGERRRPLGQGSGSTEGSGNATVAWSTGGGLPARPGSGDDALIREESGSDHAANMRLSSVEQSSHSGMPLSPSPEPMPRSYEVDRSMNCVASGMSALSMSADQRSIGLGMDSNRDGPSPDIPRTTSTSSISPENINWYYKDPTGQMQGPFAAPTMQEWYEGNYFPEDLLLRRDGDDALEPLHEIKRRVGPVPNLFLSVIPPRAPPNLAPAPQPIPQPYPVQPPALESHVNPVYGTPNYGNMDTFASSSIVSQQPGYGMPQRQPSLDSFGPISPVVPSSIRQPSPRHTIDTLYASDSTPFGNIGSSALERERARQRERDDFLRREALLVQQQQAMTSGAPLQRNGYQNGTVNRDSLYDSNAPMGNLQRMLSESANMPHPMDQQQYMSPLNTANYGPRFQSPLQGTTIETNHGFPMQMQQQQQQQQVPASPWGPAPQIQYQQPTPMQPSFDPAIVSSSPQMTGPRSPYEIHAQQFQQSISFGQQESMQEPQQAPQTAWQPQAYQQLQEHWAALPTQHHQTELVSEPEPMAEQGTVGALPVIGTEDATEQLQPSFIPDSVQVTAEPTIVSPKAPAPIARPRGESLIQSPLPRAVPPSVETKTAVTLPAPISTAVHAAVVAAPIASPVIAVAPVAPVITVPTPPSTTALPKPAPWATAASPIDDKAKAGAATSLRQIQEVEARKAETRKAAEKAERVKRAAAVSASPAVEETVPTTQSWGLAAPIASRAPVPAPEAPAAAAPWSKTGSAPKKTLKEIQEEEEKRKSLAAAAAAVTAANQGLPAAVAAAKRGYADSAKTSSSSGGVWSTVGPGGKVAAGPAVASIRPAAFAQAAPAAIRPAAAATPATTAIRVTATQIAKSPAKIASPAPADSDALVPSAEFVRWLRDSLKGLNSGVNVDEYMQMLLSFSLDPSPAVVEIIQESIYGNSSTLDGRRFAAEFISKRKADASAKKGGSTGAAVKTSLAEVVKAQPKPASPDWNFKTVVKKKGKGKN